jgi:hypothetical protein
MLDISLIFHLMFQHGPEINGNGAKLYFRRDSLQVFIRKCNQKMKTAVTVWFGIGNVILP